MQTPPYRRDAARPLSRDGEDVRRAVARLFADARQVLRHVATRGMSQDARHAPGDTAAQLPMRPAERDRVVQQVVLALLLDAHPGQLSQREIVLELTDRPEEFEQRDSVDVALRALSGAGLVHRHGPFASATRAAAYFEQLRI